MMNTQIQLVSRPGNAGPSIENFKLVKTPIENVEGQQVLLKTLFLSLDPYMRARMYQGSNYAANASLNAPMIGGTVSEVIESSHPDFEVGDIVTSAHGWQSYFVGNGKDLQKIDPAIGPVQCALGVLGLPGHTGYGGLLRFGRPKAGETVLVSAASGAVGSVVAQVAKIKECRVIGIAGGADKCNYLTQELGLDGAIDHKGTNIAGAIEKACPEGIDIYFDNVGGEIFAAVLPNLNTAARIVVCGTISVDRDQKPEIGVDRMQWLLSTVLVKQLCIQGFIYPQLLDMSEEFKRDVSNWIRSGQLKYREHIVDGLENAPEAFLGLFKGANFGKLLVRL